MSTLAPGILIAAPPLSDPHFDRSVVLLASHDEEGAFGWVINGAPVLDMDDLLQQVGLTPQAADRDYFERLTVTKGGPVAGDQVWLIYPEQHRLDGIDGQMVVAPGVCATASRFFLEELATGRRVPGLRAVAGYAGWGALQLENEVHSGAWLPGSVEPSLIFRSETQGIWQDAYALQGTTPFSFTSKTIGSA